ncbi:flagellar motor protein MotB [Methylobacillus gramineus]|uniref:flagellar motor protein MotB n=1 Tax=Methylobacillus gramineus TaxID=755169 RepID=UPI001CFF7028|nr:flagellar motor protein MotB [Methylobacillus gramineus]MCB5183802.1 flagellar motor protein MotB [Methylobacillus gramineus]
MAQENVKIIVKRVKGHGGGHHGGAWKIAYADFVTAMMAFFLLMWLLGSTSKAELEGISEYFKTPLKVAMKGGPGAGASDSVLKGGGNDMTKKQGQIRKAQDIEGKKKPDLKSAKEAVAKAEHERLKELKARIEEAIEASKTLQQFKKQLLLDITTEGLRIQIVDEQNRPMFASSKAELQPYAKQILHEIGQLLNDVPNKISLSGHTDAAPYPSGERYYSNWELSSDRANASRRELVSGGMKEEKLLRVVGLSSAVLFDKENSLNPVNRRISIIIMNKKAEEDTMNDNGSADVNSAEEVPVAAESLNKS